MNLFLLLHLSPKPHARPSDTNLDVRNQNSVLKHDIIRTVCDKFECGVMSGKRDTSVFAKVVKVRVSVVFYRPSSCEVNEILSDVI